jgi:hypothetical protein
MSRMSKIKLHSTTDEARIMELQMQGYYARRAGAHYWTIHRPDGFFTGHGSMSHTEQLAWERLITSILADEDNEAR